MSDAAFRMLSIVTKRYARDPQTRDASTRLMVLYAIALHAEATSPGDAALFAAEAVAELSRAQRPRTRKNRA
jgi:hypothetical protein